MLLEQRAVALRGGSASHSLTGQSGILTKPVPGADRRDCQDSRQSRRWINQFHSQYLIERLVVSGMWLQP